MEQLHGRFEDLAAPLDPAIQFVREGAPINRAGPTRWIDQRQAVLFSQLVREKLWPTTIAPQFNQHGGEVASDFEAEIVTPNAEGTLYFTIDGTDPRNPNDAPQETLYTESIPIEGLRTIKARVLSNEECSPLLEATFIEQSSAQLIVSEIMYHPASEGEVNGTLLEFIELRNIGEAEAHLDGFHFTDGVTYTFPSGATLAPGAYLVLASDAVEFAGRYYYEAFDTFEGNFKNSGERVALADSTGSEVVAFTYDDKAPWPKSPDGDGYSLVPLDDSQLTDPGNPSNWQASRDLGGSPGQPNSLSIRIRQEGTGVSLTWDGNPILQTSEDVNIWIDLPAATSPFTILNVEANMFWRLCMP